MARYKRRRTKRRKQQHYKRSTGQRRYRKSKGSFKLTQSKIRSSLVKDSTYLKFKWPVTFYFTVASNSDTGDARVVKSSLYDPEQRTGGNQPTGFDQWKLLYKYYKIKAMKMNFRFFNKSNDNVFIAMVPESGTTAGVAYTDIDSYNTPQLMGLPFVKWNSMTPIAGSKDTCKIKHYMTTKKIFGRPESELQGTLANIGSDPVRMWFFHIIARRATSLSGVSAAIQVAAIGYVTFYVKMNGKVNNIKDIQVTDRDDTHPDDPDWGFIET